MLKLTVVLCLYLAWSVPIVTSIRVLGLFPHPGLSHILAFQPLLHELALRGHEVTVLSFFPSKIPLKNYRDVSLEGLLPPQVEIIDMEEYNKNMFMLEFYRLREVNRIFALAVDVCSRLMDWPAFRELYNNQTQYDVVIIEAFNSACVLSLANKVGAPVIGITSHQVLPRMADWMGVPFNPAYVPSVSIDVSYNMSFSQRVYNTLTVNLFKVWFKSVVIDRETEIVRKSLGEKVPELSELTRKMSMLLINTHHSLNGPNPLPPGVVEVNGMHIRPANHTMPMDLDRIVNEAKNGVIVFSLGSMLKATTMNPEKIEACKKAFKKLPQTVIWKYEEPEKMEHLPSNVHLFKWLPQQALLHHPNVIAFIAHGGLLGMTEAVDAGVPMLVIPFFGDQPGNGAAAAEAGIATVLQYGELTEETLYTALKKVLSPEMRESAKRVSRVWRDRPMPPLETAVYWVERTARLGHDARMASRARHMPAYQLALLDVYAFLIACASLIIYINYLSIKKILSIIKHLLFTKKIKTH